MSSEAVSWVQDRWGLALPASDQRRLMIMMLAVARFCDRDGRGCHASAARLAECCRVGERQAKKLIADLKEGNHIELGDMGIVRHIPVDRRPNVYNIVGMSSRGVLQDTPVDINMSYVTSNDPEVIHRGVLQDTPVIHRGVLQRQNGVSYRTPQTPPFGGETARVRVREVSDRAHAALSSLAPCPYEESRIKNVCEICGLPRAHQRHQGTLM